MNTPSNFEENCKFEVRYQKQLQQNKATLNCDGNGLRLHLYQLAEQINQDIKTVVEQAFEGKIPGLYRSNKDIIVDFDEYNKVKNKNEDTLPEYSTKVA